MPCLPLDCLCISPLHGPAFLENIMLFFQEYYLQYLWLKENISTDCRATFYEPPCWCTMVRHSKLQKQILALYREFLRAGRDKPGFIPRIRDEFRENSQIKKTDVMHIEYLYRRGQRQLDQLKDVNTKQLGSFSGNKEDSWYKIKAKCWYLCCIVKNNAH